MPDELELVMDIETLEIFEVKYHLQDSPYHYVWEAWENS